jgi:hypothetical protein
MGSAITYTSEGYPGDGKNPRKHYKVALKQADGDWDLEKGNNRGDGTDLFRKSDNPWSAQTAYKISNQGLTLNNGELKQGVNTKSYANNGKEQYTGITIEFGEAGSTMTMKVTLAGAAPTPSPTPSPTPDVGRNNPIPSACLGKRGKRVCFTGIGKKKTKFYAKKCYFIVKKKLQSKLCHLDDHLRGEKVRDACVTACLGW